MADNGNGNGNGANGDLTPYDRITELERWRRDMEKRFSAAFPGGDFMGHCRYHAGTIENIEWKKRLWRAIIERSLSGLVWGGMLFMGLAVVTYLVTLIKKALGS